jgi:enolase-phosphatase E1
MYENIKAIVTDIEGTTTSVSFVYDILFPYARKNLADFVQKNSGQLDDILFQIAQEKNVPTVSIDEVIIYLIRWMDEDKKIKPLKDIQGLIWEDGYKTGAFKGHVFDDVPLQLERWYQDGIKLYVYSSGSVPAQKLLFGYSIDGDLTRLFSGYFDTSVGGKKESSSYTKIASEIGYPPASILFLSDSPEELDAAKLAGFECLGLQRPGNTFDVSDRPFVKSFQEIHRGINNTETQLRKKS